MRIIYLIFFDKNITHFEQDYFYIGQHNKLYDNYMGSGKIVQDIYRKYGKAIAKKTILATTETQKAVDILEVEYIKLYREKFPGQVLNICDGGAGIKFTDEELNKRRYAKVKRALKDYWKTTGYSDRFKRVSQTRLDTLSKHRLWCLSDDFEKLEVVDILDDAEELVEQSEHALEQGIVQPEYYSWNPTLLCSYMKGPEVWVYHDNTVEYYSCLAQCWRKYFPTYRMASSFLTAASIYLRGGEYNPPKTIKGIFISHQPTDKPLYEGSAVIYDRPTLFDYSRPKRNRISEVRKNAVYVLQNDEIVTYDGVKDNWKSMGFSSETSAQRAIRAGTKALETGIYKPPKCTPHNLFAAYSSFAVEQAQRFIEEFE